MLSGSSDSSIISQARQRSAAEDERKRRAESLVTTGHDLFRHRWHSEYIPSSEISSAIFKAIMDGEDDGNALEAGRIVSHRLQRRAGEIRRARAVWEANKGPAEDAQARGRVSEYQWTLSAGRSPVNGSVLAVGSLPSRCHRNMGIVGGKFSKYLDAEAMFETHEPGTCNVYPIYGGCYTYSARRKADAAPPTRPEPKQNQPGGKKDEPEKTAEAETAHTDEAARKAAGKGIHGVATARGAGGIASGPLGAGFARAICWLMSAIAVGVVAAPRSPGAIICTLLVPPPPHPSPALHALMARVG